MHRIPAGTLLFRGIDCRPECVSPVLSLNGEGVLWLAEESMTAQTYIPQVHGTATFRVPDEHSHEIDQHPRPDDDIVDTILRKLGSDFVVLRREHQLLPQEIAECEIPDNRIVGGTWGRPTSWQVTSSVTWRDVIRYLESLGYRRNDWRGFTVNVRTFQGSSQVLPARYRMRGALAILRTASDLDGYDLSTGESDCMDPAYHRAAGYAAKAAANGKDFVRIDDLAQTKTWGNVSHRSFAVTKHGIRKLELHALIPAYHREWDDVRRFAVTESPEERAWRRGLIRTVPIPAATRAAA